MERVQDAEVPQTLCFCEPCGATLATCIVYCSWPFSRHGQSDMNNAVGDVTYSFPNSGSFTPRIRARSEKDATQKHPKTMLRESRPCYNGKGSGSRSSSRSKQNDERHVVTRRLPRATSDEPAGRGD